MRIRVKGYHNFKDVMGDDHLLDMEIEECTVGEVLKRLSGRFGTRFRDLLFEPLDGGTRKDIVIFLNGVAHTHRLDTGLNDGDEIALFPVVSGG